MNFQDAAKETVRKVRRGLPQTFTVGAVTFTVSKMPNGEYSLASSAQTRRRYGTPAQIRNDVAHCLEYAQIPARIDHAF